MRYLIFFNDVVTDARRKQCETENKRIIQKKTKKTKQNRAEQMKENMSEQGKTEENWGKIEEN